jgi:hypothetical protein
VKEPLAFFHNVPCNVPIKEFEPLVKKLIKKYLVMGSQCTHWVFFKGFTKNSQYNLISSQTLKELTG